MRLKIFICPRCGSREYDEDEGPFGCPVCRDVEMEEVGFAVMNLSEQQFREFILNEED